MVALQTDGSLRYPTLHQQAGAAALAACEIGSSAAPKPRLLEGRPPAYGTTCRVNSSR